MKPTHAAVAVLIQSATMACATDARRDATDDAVDLVASEDTSDVSSTDGADDRRDPDVVDATDVVGDRGSCWDRRTAPWHRPCLDDTVCDPRETCQHGRCCSGTMSPVTCECTCSGAPECDRSQEIACCYGAPDARAGFPPPDALACRPEVFCAPIR